MRNTYHRHFSKCHKRFQTKHRPPLTRKHLSFGFLFFTVQLSNDSDIVFDFFSISYNNTDIKAIA